MNALFECDTRAARGLMRLSWNEVRARASRFAEEWKDAHYERAKARPSTMNFRGLRVLRRKVATFEETVKRAGSNAPGYIDLLWKEHFSSNRKVQVAT